MSGRATQLFSFLNAIAQASRSFEWSSKQPKSGGRKVSYRPKGKYSWMACYAKRQGYIKQYSKNNKIFFALTHKGELAILVNSFGLARTKIWDGKWREVIFDFPEDEHGHKQRDQLRRLLKSSGFKKLQGSVFICPYPLNREAIAFLKQSRLMPYIRIMKIEEMDDDNDLKKLFQLQY